MFAFLISASLESRRAVISFKTIPRSLYLQTSCGKLISNPVSMCIFFFSAFYFIVFYKLGVGHFLSMFLAFSKRQISRNRLCGAKMTDG